MRSFVTFVRWMFVILYGIWYYSTADGSISYDAKTSAILLALLITTLYFKTILIFGELQSFYTVPIDNEKMLCFLGISGCFHGYSCVLAKTNRMTFVRRIYHIPFKSLSFWSTLRPRRRKGKVREGMKIRSLDYIPYCYSFWFVYK